MLNTKEISELLKVSEETVRRWIRTKELRATQEGKSYYVTEEDLESFIEKKSSVPGTSLAKMQSLIGLGAGFINNPKTKEIATELLSKNLGKFLKTSIQSKDDTSATADLEDYITSLERQKKKLELEYQIKLLEIDDEIAKCQKLIKESK